MGRLKGSKNKTKSNIPLTPLESEIISLLEQKRKLPSGSQERIVLGRKIKALQRGEKELSSLGVSVEIPSTKQGKSDLSTTIPEPQKELYQPDQIDNNCSLKEYCLKNNKSQQFTCYNSGYLLNEGCSFYKERVK